MPSIPEQQKFFTRRLMHWHASHNQRALPWKEEKDPYRIWLSEIILQQTRAEQGKPYYLRFTETFPTIKDMAVAPDEEVFRIWQGLGYYNRCRNMLATARYIAGDLKGIFPNRHEDILALKGIGPYTAAAIASFAYNLPHAVVDGNVYRVLSRYFGIDTPIDSTAGKKDFGELADSLLDKKNSSAYNQAIMDLGATVCTPARPLCDECPLQTKCVAYNNGLVDVLPIKSKKVKVKSRYFNYLLIEAGGEAWIQKRTGNDIWQNLHQPYLIETPALVTRAQLAKTEALRSLSFTSAQLVYEGELKQRLTHQLITFRFYRVQLNDKSEIPAANGFWLPFSQLPNLAFPKSIVSFFEKKLYF